MVQWLQPSFVGQYYHESGNHTYYVRTASCVVTLMSYTYPPPQPGQHTATTFPYGAYHPPPGIYGHPQTPGTTPFPTAYPNHYPTGVTGYGTWTGYAYGYPGQQVQMQVPSRPLVQTTTATAASASTPASTTPRTTTFTSYSPSYLKDSTAATGSGGAATRGPRKQANHKGLFTKECEFVNACQPVVLIHGFGCLCGFQ